MDGHIDSASSQAGSVKNWIEFEATLNEIARCWKHSGKSQHHEMIYVNDWESHSRTDFSFQFVQAAQKGSFL